MNNKKYSKIQRLSEIYFLMISLRFSNLDLRSSILGLWFKDWCVLLLADNGLIDMGVDEIGFANDFIKVLLQLMLLFIFCFISYWDSF